MCLLLCVLAPASLVLAVSWVQLQCAFKPCQPVNPCLVSDLTGAGARSMAYADESGQAVFVYGTANAPVPINLIMSAWCRCHEQ